MCRTIHKIALITNLTQSLVDIELKYDSTTDKPMYRERGADTWLPFSSSDIDTFTWTANQSTITKTYSRPIKGAFYGLSVYYSAQARTYKACGYWFKNEDQSITNQQCWASSGNEGAVNVSYLQINGNSLTFNGQDYNGQVTVLY